MSREELSLFSYEILGLVGRGGAGAHDLLRLAQRGRILAWAGESQYYVEPKRLAKLGYLEARREPGKTRERTVYTLTDRGLEALREWAGTPAHVTPVKSEPLLRMLVADLVGEGPTRASISALREDIADLEARLDASRRAPRRCRTGASTWNSSTTICATCSLSSSTGWNGSRTSSTRPPSRRPGRRSRPMSSQPAGGPRDRSAYREENREQHTFERRHRHRLHPLRRGPSPHPRGRRLPVPSDRPVDGGAREAAGACVQRVPLRPPRPRRER